MNELLLYSDDETSISVFEDCYDTFGIHIKLRDFSGRFQFYIESNILKENINELLKIHRELEGEYILRDMDSDAYIKFLMNKFGKMSISGRLGGTHQNNYLMFECNVDQTLLENLIPFLKKQLR